MLLDANVLTLQAVNQAVVWGFRTGRCRSRISFLFNLLSVNLYLKQRLINRVFQAEQIKSNLTTTLTWTPEHHQDQVKVSRNFTHLFESRTSSRCLKCCSHVLLWHVSLRQTKALKVFEFGGFTGTTTRAVVPFQRLTSHAFKDPVVRLRRTPKVVINITHSNKTIWCLYTFCWSVS